MSLELGALLGAVQLTRAVAELTGLIESIGVKIDRLAASELRAGLRALDQAQHSVTEHESLLREARARLNKAVAIESGRGAVAAFIALAVTHRQLGDLENAARVLREFLQLNFKSPVAHAVAGDTDEPLPNIARIVAVLAFPIPTMPAIAWAAGKLEFEKQVAELQSLIRAYLYTEFPLRPTASSDS